jgi:hypothetical protein
MFSSPQIADYPPNITLPGDRIYSFGDADHGLRRRGAYDMVSKGTPRNSAIAMPLS